jgi:hypothetical protein
MEQAIPLRLLEFCGREWLSETAMCHGLDVIKNQYPQHYRRVMLYAPQFWYACTRTLRDKKLDPFLRRVRSDLNTHKNTAEMICFPLCSGQHWFTVCIYLDDKEVRIAEGYGCKPPVGFYYQILTILNTYLDVPTVNWKQGLLPMGCPVQPKDNSWDCGPIALAVIESIYSGATQINWTADKWECYRLNWIHRCIQLHRGKLPNLSFGDISSNTDFSGSSKSHPPAKDSTNGSDSKDKSNDPSNKSKDSKDKSTSPSNNSGESKGKPTNPSNDPINSKKEPTDPLSSSDDSHDSDNEFSDSSSDSGSLSSDPMSDDNFDAYANVSIADLDRRLLELQQTASTLRHRINNPDLDPSKIKSKKKPIPYSMVPITERKCDFCGPPFIRDITILHNPICSWECAIRYANEAEIKPTGWRCIIYSRELNPDSMYFVHTITNFV